MKRFYYPILTAFSFMWLAVAPATAEIRQAEAGSEYDGTYYMGLGDYYFNNSVGQTTIQVNVAVAGDSIYITDPTTEWLPTPVRALFNRETGVISFEAYVIYNEGGEVDMFAPTQFETATEELTFSSYQATYDKSTSSFLFPEYCGFSWPAWKGDNALKDAEALNMATAAGWYGVYDIESLETNKDYVLSATTGYVCPAGETITINLDAGADIDKIYCVALSGKYDASEGANSSAVIKVGQEVPDRSSLTMEIPEESGLYSFLFAGTNAAGRPVATATTYQVINIENDADWEPVADTKTVFTEGLISELFGIAPENIEVELQQHVATPGRFRFEAPYAKHSKAPELGFADEKNYIYINATDNLRVYVEPSALGITVGEYGAPYVFSWPALTAGTPEFNKENPKYFGRYMNGVITVPTVTSFNNEPYNFDAPSSLTLTLTKIDSGIDEISAAPAGSAAYDIQGRRIANPTRGLYIINRHKFMVK